MAARFSRPLLRNVGASAVHQGPRAPAFNALTARAFASASRGSNAALKADFKRWLKKELALLAFMVAAGATGVHFYQVQRMMEPQKEKR